jgi:excisionase family DNA binding protein
LPDLTVRDVAAELSVNPETVKRMLQSGRLSGYKVGSRWRMTQGAVAQYKLGTSNNYGAAGNSVLPTTAMEEEII